MKDTEYNQLIALLTGVKESTATECLELIRKSKPGYMDAGSIPANQVLDIYSKRQAWNESMSNPKRNQIIGYELLMMRLPKSSDQKVKIHMLEWRDTTVMIFTDEGIASLFGALRIPKL